MLARWLMDQGNARSKCKKTLFLVTSPEKRHAVSHNFFANRSARRPQIEAHLEVMAIFGAQSRICLLAFAAHDPQSAGAGSVPASYAPAAATLSPQRSWRSLRTTGLASSSEHRSRRVHAPLPRLTSCCFILLEDANSEKKKRLFASTWETPRD